MSAFIQGRVRSLLVVAFVIALVAAPTAVSAATITVTGLTDTLVTDGSCSIREAIINANNDAATWPDCAAGSGEDTIILPAGTITFTIANPIIPGNIAGLDSDQLAAAGDLDITSSMTIAGDPVGGVLGGTIIDADELDRVFDINPAPDTLPGTTTPLITVHFSNLEMMRGRQNQSGGIRIN